MAYSGPVYNKNSLPGEHLYDPACSIPAFIVRNMAHQGIRTERDPHSIPGQIVGSDLLVQLQFYFGENMGIMADAVCPGAGIISGF